MTCPFLICFKEIRSMLLNGVKRIFNALLLLKKTKEIVLWTFQYKYYNYCYLLCTTCLLQWLGLVLGLLCLTPLTTFQVISWRSVLLVKETWVPQVTGKLYHIMLYRVHLVELTTLVVIGTDCIGSCKSNYHMIMTTMAPLSWSFK